MGEVFHVSGVAVAVCCLLVSVAFCCLERNSDVYDPLQSDLRFWATPSPSNLEERTWTTPPPFEVRLWESSVLTHNLYFYPLAQSNIQTSKATTTKRLFVFAFAFMRDWVSIFLHLGVVAPFFFCFSGFFVWVVFWYPPYKIASRLPGGGLA